MTPQDIESTQVPQPAALPAPAVSPRVLADELLRAKAAGEYAAARVKDLKTEADTVFNIGERLSVVSPVNPRKILGTVNYTNPEDKAIVSDEKAFLAWMVENHPKHVQQVETLACSVADAIDMLRMYAPPSVVAGLVTSTPTVADYVRNQVLKTSASAGQVVGPEGELDDEAPAGVSIVEGTSQVRISLKPDAVDHLVGLWERGQVQLPGIPAADTSAA